MVGISALLLMQRAEVLVGSTPASLKAIRWGTHTALGVLWAGAFLAVWSLSNCAPEGQNFLQHNLGRAWARHCCREQTWTWLRCWTSQVLACQFADAVRYCRWAEGLRCCTQLVPLRTVPSCAAQPCTLHHAPRMQSSTSLVAVQGPAARADMANVWAYFRHPSGPAALGPGTPLLDSPHESGAAGPGLSLPRRRSSPLPTAVYTNGSGSKGKQT